MLLSKKEITYLIVFFVLGAALIFQSFQAEKSGSESILETIEKGTEIVNTVLSLTAAFLAIQVIKIFGVGAQADPWRWMTVAGILFAIFEIVSFLKKMDVWKVGGLIDYMGFFFVIALIYGFYKQKKVLTGNI
ncbi:hypothetical protein HZB04_01995 [Candidatus Wolfebacteria bacterium]|nr:hypothetical protein [Candidatus Wolfebacteria bacterium]